MTDTIEKLKDKLSLFLSALKESRKLSPDDIAQRSGGSITRATVYGYIKKKTTPDLKGLLILADVTDKKPGQFIDDLLEGRMKAFLESKDFTDSDFYAMYLDYISIKDESQKHDANVLLEAIKGNLRKLSRSRKDKEFSRLPRQKKRMPQGDGLPRKR